MAFVRSKAQLELSKDHCEILTRVAQSRTDRVRCIERSRLLLNLTDQHTPNEIAAEHNIQAEEQSTAFGLGFGQPSPAAPSCLSCRPY